MHLVHKLILISITTVGLIWFVGLTGARVAEESLRDSIERFSEERAAAALDEVHQEIHARLNEWRAYSFNPRVLRLLAQTNGEFTRREDARSLIRVRDREWQATPANRTSPLMDELLNGVVAKQFAEILDMHQVRSGHRVYVQALLTNSFGINVAQTGRTADYLQSDEAWWQQSMAEGTYIGGMAFDAKAQRHTIDLCLRVDDREGTPAGVLKVVLSTEGLFRILDQRFARYGNSDGTDVTLFDESRQLLHYVGAQGLTRDQGRLHFAHLRSIELPSKGGTSITSQDLGLDTESLCTLAMSTDQGESSGLGWVLLIRYPAKAAFAEINQLWALVLWVAGISTALTVTIGGLICTSVSRRSRQLIYATTVLGKGDLSVRVPVHGNDEFGALAQGFNQMAQELETLTISAQVKVIMLATKNRELEHEVQERQRAEGLATQVLESTADPIVVIDAAGKILSASASVESVFQWEPESAVGNNISLFIPVEDREEHLAVLNAFLTESSENQSLLGRPRRLQGLRKDGTVFPMELTSSRVLSSAEPLFVEILRDLSVRLRLEEELECARRLESIGQLAAGIAHEINTPTQYVGDNTRFLDDSFQELIPVFQKAEALAEAVQSGTCPPELAEELKSALTQADTEFLSEEIPRAIEQSLSGIERVRKIVQSMREFSHPGIEGMTSIDLNRAIESTITVASNEWKYVADLDTDFDAALPPVTCFAGEVNQVVLNMIVNAAHAITDANAGKDDLKGKIHVSTRLSEPCVEIRIEDTGGGIPPEVQGKIFDPFFTTKEVGRGTGQGLSIAYSIVVKTHGGTLDFETVLGVGTTFIIRLPLDRAPAEGLAA